MLFLRTHGSCRYCRGRGPSSTRRTLFLVVAIWPGCRCGFHTGIFLSMLPGTLVNMSETQNIVRWETVTADGSIRYINATEEPDLAVAMRGSGSQFGSMIPPQRRRKKSKKKKKEPFCRPSSLLTRVRRHRHAVHDPNSPHRQGLGRIQGLRRVQGRPDLQSLAQLCPPERASSEISHHSYRLTSQWRSKHLHHLLFPRRPRTAVIWSARRVPQDPLYS